MARDEVSWSGQALLGRDVGAGIRSITAPKDRVKIPRLNAQFRRLLPRGECGRQWRDCWAGRAYEVTVVTKTSTLALTKAGNYWGFYGR